MFQEDRESAFLRRWKNKMQYVSDHCSLQVVGYVLTPSRVPLIKRIFWLVALTGCCVCSANVLRSALSLYTTVPVSFSVETDYLEFDTPFPTLTICEDYITEAHGKHITNYLKGKNMSLDLSAFIKEVSFWNNKFCTKCTRNCDGHQCVDNFIEVVNGVKKKCTELLTTCSWGGEEFPCCERFKPIETEYGTCFVFNSRVTGNGSIYTLNRNTGLLSLAFEAIEEVNIRVHTSEDILTVATNVASEKVLGHCDRLPLITHFDLILSVEQTISDLSIQRLAPSNRDCLFRDERPTSAHLWPFQHYSYSTCLLYYRAVTQAEVCNCTHHLMPNIRGIPKCDIEGLMCLSLNKDNLGIEKYHCPMSCDDVSYTVVHATCPRHIGKVQDGHAQSRGSHGLVRLGHLPSMRVRRHAIRELLGLVVDISGVISVFFGASLLSFIELIYLLFLRRYD